MQWRNSSTRFGLIAVFLHWLVALAVIGLFVLGLWMTDLNYYHSWYHRAPALHKSLGLLLTLIVLLRLFWRLLNTDPDPEPGMVVWEILAARVMHWTLYGIMLCLFLSGYLISTADGRGIAVFDWFEVPATLSGLENQEDIAGDWHRWLAYTLIGLTVLHTLAALKHHFYNRDRTLLRMLGGRGSDPDHGERPS